MAKSVITLMALLLRDRSIWMIPPRRANVPETSSPLAFIAGNHTWTHTDEQVESVGERKRVRDIGRVLGPCIAHCCLFKRLILWEFLSLFLRLKMCSEFCWTLSSCYWTPQHVSCAHPLESRKRCRITNGLKKEGKVLIKDFWSHKQSIDSEYWLILYLQF